MEELLWYLEILEAISLGVLVLGSGMYLRELNIIKKQRKLSTFEYTLYLLIGVAFLVIAIKLLIEAFLG